MKRKHPEEDVQREVIAFLAAVLPHAVVFAVPNGSRRTKGGKASNAVPGLLPGAPDLAVCLPYGRVLWVECKAPKGTLSDAQHALWTRLRGLGHDYCVVRSQGDVRAALAALGIVTREAKGLPSGESHAIKPNALPNERKGARPELTAP